MRAKYEIKLTKTTDTNSKKYELSLYHPIIIHLTSFVLNPNMAKFLRQGRPNFGSFLNIFLVLDKKDYFTRLIRETTQNMTEILEIKE